jgi:hypothetical protein
LLTSEGLPVVLQRHQAAPVAAVFWTADRNCPRRAHISKSCTRKSRDNRRPQLPHIGAVGAGNDPFQPGAPSV